MKSNPIVQVFVLLSVLLPWYGPSPSTLKFTACSKQNARTVRKIVDNKWWPILRKFNVERLPLQCPFHPQRDIFGPQTLAKNRVRSTQWTCILCGKSFYEEHYLDAHLDNRHKDHINLAEDAVCLADYCDIMRCEVLTRIDSKILMNTNQKRWETTDVDIWRENYHQNQRISGNTGLSVGICAAQKHELGGNQEKSCSQKKGSPQQQHQDDQNRSCGGGAPCQQQPQDNSRCQRKLDEIRRRHKATCQPDKLNKLQMKCKALIHDCIAGLVLELSTVEYKQVEDALNRAVCWYLTCDRYWEDSHSDLMKTFSWGLLCMILMVLSFGLCLCYYIIWILFDTDSSSSVISASVTDRSTPTPIHQNQTFRIMSERFDAPYGVDCDSYYPSTLTTTDVATKDSSTEYIYVTYPPEIKQRLLDSCYNRTTHL